jgi:hypothetical protein
MADFGISGVEPLGSATRELVKEQDGFYREIDFENGDGWN